MRILPAAIALLIVINAPALAQDASVAQPRAAKAKKPRNLAAQCAKAAFAKANPRSCAPFAKADAPAPPPAPAAQTEIPSRPDFTADDQAAAIIPGVPAA